MSLVHIRFNKVGQERNLTEYSVESPDFSAEGSWQVLGHVRIDAAEMDYVFTKDEAWTDVVTPPEMFANQARIHALPSSLRGCEAWSGVIHATAMRLIRERQFPERA